MRNQNPERCSNLPKGTQPAPDSTPGASILERPLHRFLLSAAAPRGAWCRHAPHLGPQRGPRPGEAPAPRPLERPGPSSLLQVFQKRFNGSVSFFRGWNDYKLGFGRADGEYWLGLQNLHLLTLKQKYELRVDLEDFENNTAFAKYAEFSISPNAVSAEEDGYSLHVAGFEDGGAGDSLSYHSGQKFSTFDRDQDLFVQNCAALSSGAFWFRSCHFANLNGFYLGGSHLSYANGINWAQWKGFYYSLKRTEMKIRRA
ncbi:microfibril-associated glycoprotein 4 isoform X1 [Orcinus orca]|uniref:microfibril-associated glycoprotein 4 isoform X1 n=1 Tax=Orcinus orca TaxID=9733 RepID=UPI001441F9EF|nr:microfibril-associated glycoprotein 4 isoform X1 [Orcinus orca]